MRDSYAPVPEIVCTKKKKNIKELGITFPPSALLYTKTVILTLL
jgi:hypothetical protein